MQYLGSKNKISKYILPIILQDRRDGQKYVEPFVGGCNMIDKVEGARWGNDNNYYLISLWKSLQNGYIPPDNITKEEYYEIKNNKNNFPPELVAFVGFLCSFGGKEWGGYAFNNKGDNYALRGKRCLLKQVNNLKDVVFTNLNYKLMEIENSIIYCDPPYENTTKYKTGFNSEEFWEWCRQIIKNNNKIYISEYNAPADFICMKEIIHKTILNKNSQDKRIEKLFTLKK